jgi:hypothetical protein
LVWFDSAINAVSDAEEGVVVKTFFNNLSRLMREHDLLGIGLTLHTRKRAQGAHERRFDDLFGSREWKGRLNTLAYIEGTRIVSWKNRGGRLARRFKSEPGKRPYAILNRPGLQDVTAIPFNVTAPDDMVAANDAEIVARVREILTAQPDVLTKSALALAAGGRKAAVLKVIEQLQLHGEVVPDQLKAKLRMAGSESVDIVQENADEWQAAADV